MSKLEKRAAALRVDYTSTTQLADSAPSVAELTQELVKLSTQVPSKLFYAPFGHGAAPPPLLYPAPACPMFGSVPIWTAHIGAAASRVHLLAPAPAPPTTWTLRLHAVCAGRARGSCPHTVVLEQLAAQDRTCLGGGVPPRQLPAESRAANRAAARGCASRAGSRRCAHVLGDGAAASVECTDNRVERRARCAVPVLGVGRERLRAHAARAAHSNSAGAARARRRSQEAAKARTGARGHEVCACDGHRCALAIL